MFFSSVLVSNVTSQSNDDEWFAPCEDANDRECFAYAILPSIAFGIVVFLSVFTMIISTGAAQFKDQDISNNAVTKLVRVSTVILVLSVAILPIIATISDNVENPSSAYVISSVLDVLLVIVSWLAHDETCAYYGSRIPRSRALCMILIHSSVLTAFGFQIFVVIHESHNFYFYANMIRGIAATFWFWVCFCRVLYTSKQSDTSTTHYVPLEDPSRSKEEEKTSLSPESRSGWFSRISFSWMNDLMKIGASRTLEDQDLYPLLSKDKTDLTSSKLEVAWKQEEESGSPSLSRAIRKALGFEFIMAGFIKFVYDTLQFVAPQLLKAIVGYLKDDVPKSDKGWWIVSLLCLNTVCQTVLLHQYFHICFRTGMRIKAATAAIVFRKALVLDPAAMSENVEEKKKDKIEKEESKESDDAKKTKEKNKKKLNSRGAIVNLMSVDAQRLQDLCPYLHMLWSGPYQICLALYFLSRELGGYTAVGVTIMVLMIPISGYIMTRVRALQKLLMKQKDERMKVTNEALSGMRILKLNAWGQAFSERIKSIRDTEMGHLWNYTFMTLLGALSWSSAPVLVSSFTFAAFALFGNEDLTATRAFTALSLINLLQFPLFMLPRTISNVMEATVTIDRLRTFLTKPSLEPRPNLPAARVGEENAVSVSPRSNFFWDTEKQFPLLRDLSLSFKSGTLNMIIGRTGSGKSGLCNAIIGDLLSEKGERVVVRGRLAYAPQVAFIQNMTVRENILFGRPFDPAFYDRVVDACALRSDFDVLPGGDQCEIGAKGINLSGGQRQRVALARACYQQSDVYLFDDSLSAVDNHVAQHIFRHCILNLLRKQGKTVILITNNIAFLNAADKIVCLDGEKKRVKFSGTYDECLRANIDLVELEKDQKDNYEVEETKETNEKIVDDDKDKEDDTETKIASRTQTTSSSLKEPLLKDEKSTSKNDGANLIEKESVFTGAVGWGVYAEYARACGGSCILVIVLIAIVVNQGLLVGSGRWLAAWSENETGLSTGVYVGVYAGLGIGGLIMSLVSQGTFAVGSVRASHKLHNELLDAMMRAPMSFFDTTPLGRIQNRFSKDMYAVDEALAYALRMYLRTAAAAISTILVITVVTPFFLVGMIPVIFLYWKTQNYYIPTSRQLKRINSKMNSPIYDHFEETLDGVSSIRAFNVQKRFVKTNTSRVDRQLQGYYLSIASNRWLATRLECVGTGIVTLAAAFAVYGKGPENFAGLGGLSITYALSVTQTLNWMVRMTSERETNIVSVERVTEYASVRSEGIRSTKMPPQSWPQSGAIELRGLQLRYRPGLPLVLGRYVCSNCGHAEKTKVTRCEKCGNTDNWRLVGIDAKIRAGEKVGIVGRTGSGKSSLLYSFMRLVEPCGGQILVDDVNTAELELSELRGRISIIPQEPWLCAGTVRFNVDPPGQFTDKEIWEALDRAHFGAHIRNLPSQLDHNIEEGGKNLSQGQAQLICLARALLVRSTILLLDEATAAVDNQTDALIQQTIRKEFASCTIITIAHRIDTITDSDRIMVMDEGRVVEFDSPSVLLDRPTGHFRKMYDARPSLKE